MVFIHVYHSKAWLVDDYRDPALETNVTRTVTGAATKDPLFEPDPKKPAVTSAMLTSVRTLACYPCNSHRQLLMLAMHVSTAYMHIINICPE